MWSRVGTGNVGAIVAAIGFATGATLMVQWPLGKLGRAIAAAEPGWEIDGSLTDLVGVSTWLGVGVSVVVIVTLLAVLGRANASPAHWPWIATGIALGALGILAWITGAWSDWNWGLSVTGPARSLVNVLLLGRPQAANWGTAMLVGLPIGAWLSARVQGSVSWRMPPRAELGRQFGGGVVMGIGGTLATGCNIGNALTGLSILAVNSIIATAGIFLGAALAIGIGAWRVPSREPAVSSD